MKNEHIIIVLLTLLFVVEISNQAWMIRTSKTLDQMHKEMKEFFEPILPEWEEEKGEVR